MAGSVAEAFVTLRPDTDRFGPEMSSKLGALAGVAGKAMLGVGAAITGVAVAGIREFAQLESGMNEVFTLLPGISESAMGSMTEDVRDFAKEMGTSTKEVVPALYQAISAGVPQDNVFDFLETANKAAIGGVTTLETAVDGISSVVNAYGEDVINAGEASDLMFTAVRLGKTNFEELSRSLFQVIPTASALGVEFGDVTGALANLTAQGVPTSVATTQLRQLFVELSKEGGVAADVFKDMSGKTFKDFIAEGGNTADALDIMREAAEESGVGLQDMFGSVEAGAAALALASGDTDAYREALDEMAGSAGATEAAHEQMDQGLARAWERIKTNVTVALGEIGERLAPTFQEFADWIVANMPAITDFVVGAFETIADFITGTVVPAFQTVIGWWQENGPDIIGRVVAVRDAIVEFGSAVKGWWDENGPAITERVVAVRDAIVEFGERVAEWWTETVKPYLDEFFAAVQENWPTVKETIDTLGEVFTNLGDAATAALDIVKAIFGDTAEVTDEETAQMKSDVETVIDALNAFAEGAEKVTSGVSDRMEMLAGLFEGDTDRMFAAAGRLSERAFPGMATSFFTAAGRIRVRVNDVVEWFQALPGRIEAALSGFATLLTGIGRGIIGGLFAGMRARWAESVSWLSGLGSQIQNLKGPIEKDRVLLEDIGQEIIGGLGRGMNREWGNIERMLGTMTADIPLNVDAVDLAGGTRLTQAERPPSASGVVSRSSTFTIGEINVADVRQVPEVTARMRAYQVAYGG